MTDTATRPAVHLHVAGERMDKGSGGSYDHVDPSTGQVDATVPLAGPGEVDRAVNGADGAFRELAAHPAGRTAAATAAARRSHRGQRG